MSRSFIESLSINESFGLPFPPDLGKEAWGKGYTTEAMREVIKFGKEKLELIEIVGRHAKENKSSENVLKKLGFEYVRDIPYECNRGKIIMEGKECILKL